MTNNFITNTMKSITLKDRLQKLISASSELKFLVGFFYFSGWQEIYKELQKNKEVKLKILVGLQVDKYLSGIVEIENKDDSLSREEHFTQFIKSLGYAINHADMGNEEFYNQIVFFIKLLEDENAPTDSMIVVKTFEKLINMSSGSRPLRTIAGLDFGMQTLNDAVEPIRKVGLESMGFAEWDGPKG